MRDKMPEFIFHLLGNLGMVKARNELSLRRGIAHHHLRYEDGRRIVSRDPHYPVAWMENEIGQALPPLPTRRPE